ncbi:glycosyltransferase [Weissella confusa]|uniref:Glycosyltransferase n=1 Tax=Weissella confusa TaxID=1583 RepID=A0AAJ2YXC5_WEICO|nr:glycosyltransferase [Weissella confusa]NBA11172.1 glycosyltransferase [Weissella confusa]
MTKIGALIVTFNPDMDRLDQNITAVKDQVETIVIVDNGSINIKEIEEKANFYNLDVIHLHNERGIAGAQNKGMQYLRDLGVGWSLTLDQDSVMPVDAVEKFINSNAFTRKETGLIAAQYDDPNWTEEQRNDKLDNSGRQEIQKKMVIASGNLVKVSAWEKVQGYDEWMFIDQVDFDFNAKLLLAGYEIWQINTVVMTHEVGAVIQRPCLSTLLLFPKKAIFADHSSFREYYIQRNTIVYSKRYPEFRRHKLQTLVSIVQSRRILVYSDPLPKILAAWRGIVDGFLYSAKKDTKFQSFRKMVKENYEN